MRILIANPPRYRGISVTRERRCEELLQSQVIPPTTLLTLASLLRNRGHNVFFIDANAFNLSFQDISVLAAKKKVDYVVFTFNHMILDHDLKLCGAVKKANCKCRAVGYSWFAREFAKEILARYPLLDILIVDDPLSVVESLFDCLNAKKSLNEVKGIAFHNETGAVKVTSRIGQENPLASSPMPAYDLLPTMKPYHMFNRFFNPLAFVFSSRGCPGQCRFCNVAGTKYEARPPAQVVEELKLLEKLGKVRFVWFYDEVFTIDRQRVRQLCERMIEEHVKLKWFCDTRVDLVDSAMLGLMHKAGCVGISFGVESGSPRILQWMNKNFTIEQCAKAIALARQEHVPVQINILYCPYQETAESLEETAAFLRMTLPNKVDIGPVDPHPGSRFGEEILGSTRNLENLTTDTEVAAGYPFPKPVVEYYLARAKATKKALFFSPKWWVYSATCLLWNPSLVAPLIQGYLTRQR